MAKRRLAAKATYTFMDDYLAANKSIAPLAYVWHDLKDEENKLKTKDKCPEFLLDPADRDIHGPLVGTRVRVVLMDSFDAAIAMAEELRATSNDPPVAVLNFMNPEEPGGGFWRGAQAQEEQLCYRSTLFPSLEYAHMQGQLSGFGINFALYHPRVGVIRSTEERGYKWFNQDEQCPIVAVISVAALYNPKKSKDKQNFANPADAEFTLNQIRLALRIAKRYNHSRLVLGALGCGAFSNPNRRVAELFRLVLLEKEFQGGWWEAVWFAIYNKKITKECNYVVFKDVVEGLVL